MALDTSGIFLTNLLTFLINCPISRREHKHVILSGLESSVCGFIESFSGTIQRCGSSCHLPFNHQSVLGRISCFLTSSRFDSLPLGKMCVFTSPGFCYPCPLEEGCYWAGEALMGSGHILDYLLWQSGLHQKSGLLLICCLYRCPP